MHLPADKRIAFSKVLKRGRHVYGPVTLMYGLTEQQIAIIVVNQFLLPGFEVEAPFVREYPFKELFAHSLDYVGRINQFESKHLDQTEYSGTQSIGKTGVENFYEQQLHGHVGYEEAETNAQGRVMRVLRRTDPVAGKILL